MNKPQPNSLKQIVGLGFGLAVIVGGTLGAGILRMPSVIAGYTTNSFLFIFFWILGGLIALVGASIYAELGTRLHQAGGPFVFAQKAFGNAGGFIAGSSDWLFMASSISYLSIAIAEYVNKLMKWDLPVGLNASLIITFFAILQWQGLKSSSNFQKIVSAINAICMLLFVGACFVYFFGGHSYPEVLTSGTPHSLPFLSIFILSIRAVFVTYTGWNSAVYFNEEDTNPNHNLPRALIYGVLSVMIIFVLINLGLIAVMPLSAIAQTNLPAAEAAQLIFGGWGGNVVTLISIISLTTCLAATLLIPPRILFAISRKGLFFNVFATLNKHSIPGYALILTALVSIIFSSTGLFNVVVNMAALFALIADLSVYIAIVFIRKQDPSIVPPFKAWAYPFSALFMIFITLSLIVGVFIEDTMNCLYALAVIVLAFPFYFLSKSKSAVGPALAEK